MQLSERLQAIADMVTPGRKPADIGTDHAYIPIWLVLNKKVVSALASDIGEGPLKRAEENIKREGLSGRVGIRRSDGLHSIRPGETDCLILAGMGGALTVKILTEGKEKLEQIKELILEPQAEAWRVRNWILSAGYAIADENMVEEDGKFYPVIKALKKEKPDEAEDSVWSKDPQEKECQLYFGPVLLKKNHPVLKRFLEKEEALCDLALQQIREKGSSEAGEKRARELRQRKERIACAFALMNAYAKETADEGGRRLPGSGVLLRIGKKIRSYPLGTTYEKIAEDFRNDSPDDILLIRENNRLREFHHIAKDQSDIRFITVKDKAGKSALLRSYCLLMNRAMHELSGDDSAYDIKVLFTIDEGLFCTIQDPSLITEDLLRKLDEKMRELADKAIPIRKKTVSTQKAKEVFHNRRMYDKEQLFRYRLSSFTNIYELDGYEDYFYGYMVHNTSLLKHFELVRYADGFVIRIPDPQKGEFKRFAPDGKLFEVQRGSFIWGEKLGVEDVGDLNDVVVTGGMPNLILVQEAYHEMQISRIAEKIASDPCIKIVLIAGPSSSGKTTFSHRLSTQLSVHGLRPHPIPVDDYFVDREKTPLDENGNYNFEVLEAIDIDLFNKDMNRLLAGEEVSLPTFNFRLGKREYKGKTLQLGPEDILVIEGIHGLNEGLTYSLPKENKYKIYISALTQLSVDEHNRISTTDGRLIRRMVRDARTRGYSAEETLAMWPSVRRGEEENIFPHQHEADVMFNSALIYELAVLKIYAEPLLYGIKEESPHFCEANRLLKFLSYFVPVAPDKIPMNSLLREFIGGSCFDV